jgi:ankyrin repeat protein
VTEEDANGQTPLKIAVSLGYVDMAKILLEHGTSSTCTDVMSIDVESLS